MEVGPQAARYVALKKSRKNIAAGQGAQSGGNIWPPPNKEERERASGTWDAMGHRQEEIGSLGGNKSDLSPLAAEQTKEPNLTYPLDVDETRGGGHYVMFHILQSKHGKLAKEANRKLSDINSRTAAQYHATPKPGTTGRPGFSTVPNVGQVVKENYNNYINSEHTAAVNSAPSQALLVKRGKDWTSLKQTITLYMPPSVKVAYKTDYADTPISARAVAGVSAIEAGKAAWMESEGLMALGNAVVASAKSGIQEGALVGLMGAMAAADTAAPGSSALAQITAGSVVGSKMELLFQGVGRRDFQYVFTFIPKSEEEASMIAKIVYAFKINMLPEYRGGSFKFGSIDWDINKSGRLLVMPNAFDIQYMYLQKENPWINKISSCYLTNMEVEYGGDKYVTYYPMQEPISGKSGPPPQRTVMSLSFSEIEILTRESAMAQAY